MKMDLLKFIQSLENDKLSSILLKFNEIIQERDSEITLLRNKVADLEARVIEQEIYSSKNCLIIKNLPIEDRNAPLSHQVCQFFQKFLNHETRPNNFKACHYLGKWQSNTCPPAVIAKFLFFDEKNELLGRKSWLSRKTNQCNGYPIYIKERLPRHQKEILDFAKAENTITTTVNCKVKVFEQSDDGSYRGVEVNSKKLSLT